MITVCRKALDKQEEPVHIVNTFIKCILYLLPYVRLNATQKLPQIMSLAPSLQNLFDCFSARD